ncbi:hypothetical protein [Lacibacter sediminis]|uniref:Copper resistance protein NlpE n=1 Tax=Lacibacter sediminis TaxID=2760713 RepID=A0A7G5XBC4_9BACT|nr:hypothetical protein [Lacibacter sediminis]QNA42777.1 hypothetical protein H4075_11780 [Lacibacter sediminis]
MRQAQQLIKALPILLSLFVFSCNNETEKADTKTDTIAVPPTSADDPAHFCYEFINNRDTVMLELVVGPDDMVSGDLLYQLAGKDRNKGTIKGVLHNDTVLADYTFMSEGKQSVRELTFLKKDSSLTEGYAAMEEKDGKMQFKSGVIPSYNGLKLILTNCKN